MLGNPSPSLCHIPFFNLTAGTAAPFSSGEDVDVEQPGREEFEISICTLVSEIEGEVVHFAEAIINAHARALGIKYTAQFVRGWPDI